MPLDSVVNCYPAGGPAISADGNILYFHSNRSGGYGGYDIWKSVKIGGAWQAPVNLGPDVNNSGNETEPSVDELELDLVFQRSRGYNDTANI